MAGHGGVADPSLWGWAAAALGRYSSSHTEGPTLSNGGLPPGTTFIGLKGDSVVPYTSSGPWLTNGPQPPEVLPQSGSAGPSPSPRAEGSVTGYGATRGGGAFRGGAQWGRLGHGGILDRLWHQQRRWGIQRWAQWGRLGHGVSLKGKLGPTVSPGCRLPGCCE